MEERSSFFSDHDVRVRANRIWVRKGRPEGQAAAHWREGLAELEAEGLAKREPVPPRLVVSNPTGKKQTTAYMTLGEAYSVGMRSIDEEHRELMDLINQIHEALHTPAPQDKVKEMFQRLAACVSTHFWQEESQFEGTGYQDAALHTRKHEHLTTVLSGFQSGIDGMGRSVSFENQLSFLRDWLLDHIANEDQQFADYINAQERPPRSAAV